MPVGRIYHKFSVTATNEFLRSPRGGIMRDLMARGYRVESVAKRLCPADHGRLRGSIHTEMGMYHGRPMVRVGTDVDYAIWVHNGTGLYGPRAALIRPVHAKAMRFEPRKSNGVFIAKGKRKVVFARTTKGMRPRPFLRDALPAMMG